MDDKPKITGWNYDDQTAAVDPQLQEIRQQQQMKAAINAVGNSMAQDVKDDQEIKDRAEESHNRSLFNPGEGSSYINPGTRLYDPNSTPGLLEMLIGLFFYSVDTLDGKSTSKHPRWWLILTIPIPMIVVVLWYLYLR